VRTATRMTTVYVGEDGAEFDSPEACQRHEILELMHSDGVCQGGEWSPDMVAAWIHDHLTELASIAGFNAEDE
jgi:hypothetical protein